MPTETIISANIPGHGLYRCTARAFQGTIEKYLPTSVAKLRTLCEERADVDMSDITDIGSFLVMIAEWDAEDYRDPYVSRCWVETEAGGGDPQVVCYLSGDTRRR